MIYNFLSSNFISNLLNVFIAGLIFLIPQNSVEAQHTITTLNQSQIPVATAGKCFTDQLIEQQRQTVPGFQHRLDAMNHALRTGAGARQNYTIPVVVHVIHQNGAENIPDEQIYAGIQHLNDGFANAGSFSHPDGVDTHISFCLAAQTPDGQFTTGITRTVSDLTNLTVELQDFELKDLIRWDPNSYLNIWLVKEISSLSMGDGMAGYAYFPTSQGQPEDGIVNEAALFGSTPDNSKVHIHEAGHYLGLYHTFEGGCTNQNCQTDGDRVCDTPPDNSTAPVPCSGQPNTCSTDADDVSENNPFRPVAMGGLGDQPDQFKNYMDYGYQVCQTFFSPGQSARMQAAISTQRAILLESIACQSPCADPISISVSADNTTVPIGGVINFSSVTNGANSFEWTINGEAVGDASTLEHQFTTSGSFEVILTAYNDDPNCMSTASIEVNIVCPAQASFEVDTSSPYIPGDEISTTNTSINNTSNQWMLDGNPVSTSPDWSQIFNEVGGHSLYLIVGNGECADTSNTYFFQVGNCDLSGVTDHWVFLRNQIKFDDGEANLIPNSPIQDNGNECSSSIADADGNLLLFSDGVQVWDREMNVMPNGSGLMGNPSASQGVLITPHPGNANQYFVFTTDAVENALANGMRYSIVDMTLNNGYGDIIPAFKNKPLLEKGSEKLSATWHANGHDIWVGSGEYTSNAWYAFLIDHNGIHTTPVMSNIGTPSNQNPLGSMRFSNDGNRMAAGIISAWPWRILVSDFNRETGVYSNPIELVLSTDINQQPFGIAFSPDNSKLYVSFWQGDESIYQYDLSQTTAAQIMDSRYAVTGNFCNTGQLVLASNGIIYAKTCIQNGLSAITNPNAPGALCGFTTNAVSISAANHSNSSLPNMLQGYLMAHEQVIVGPENICQGGTSYEYQISFESEQDSAVWSHTGPGIFSAQEGNNTATLVSAAETGTDIISVTIYGRCGISHDTITVQTNEPELTYLPETATVCDSLLLDPGAGFLSYEWSNATYETTLTADTTGLYTVTVKGQSGCIIADSTYVVVSDLEPVDLGPDQEICEGQLAFLQTNPNYINYEWQDGSQESSFTAFTPGTYWVTVDHGCGVESTDTVEVFLSDFEIDLNYQGEDHICSSILPFTLNAPAGYESYMWDNGQNTSSILIDEIGEYSLTVLNADGCSARDTLWVDDCTGITQNNSGINVIAFPNPADDFITVSTQYLEIGTLSLYSITGQLIFQEQVTPKQEMIIASGNLANGMYVLELRFENETGRYKIAVSH